MVSLWCSLLLLHSCLAKVAFENRTELRAALLAWEGYAVELDGNFELWARSPAPETFPDRSQLISTYGGISEWDTSKITDMSGLLSFLQTFNESIGSWNTSAVTDMSFMFHKARRFNSPIGTWDTSAVTDMSSMFYKARSFNQPVENWNTSAVTDMSGMFDSAKSFNQSLQKWDTSAVTHMSSMFYNARSFNHPIGTWDTSCVRYMDSMFNDALSFNQPVENWNTSAVTDMRGMFSGAMSFNQSLQKWDTSAVIAMSKMLEAAEAFNCPLGLWNTSAVKDMSGMFSGAMSFNQPVGTWKTSAVTDMSSMFSGAMSFNQPIGTWDTSAVTYMDSMFLLAESFNQPIGTWDTSDVRKMSSMFYKARSFNQPIGTWDTSGVTDMDSMFLEAESFNQPIGTWDTSNVRNMSSMFYKARSFNQPIGTWNTLFVRYMDSMFLEAESFNQPIGTWGTSRVKSMDRMFYDARSFDMPLGSWDIPMAESRADMFGGTTDWLQPPCTAGRGPGGNHLMCKPCGMGQHAVKGGFCQACPPGSAPSEDRGTCDQCPPSHYSVSGLDGCFECNGLLLLMDNDCVRWHLPLLVLGFGFAVAAVLGPSWLRSRRAKKAKRLMEERAEQSKRAGVSIEYLLSAEFAELATQRTGRADPTFADMKTAFWLSEDPIGRDIICPRDGRAGCALVDWIPRSESREQTHFMSWTWRYSLLQVCDALESFQGSAKPSTSMASSGTHSKGVFFFMCFFVSNQYRLIVEESSTGSDNLEEVFEGNLKRIGRMVAILDNWDRPVYLSRVWTVYEQFVASTIDVQVQFVLPKAPTDQLQHQIARGSAGIDEVIKSLCQVNSREAKAWKMEDEIKVKSVIQDTVGFQHVDAHVTDVMTTWIGDVLEQTCKQLLKKAHAEAVQTIPTGQVFAGVENDDADPLETVHV